MLQDTFVLPSEPPKPKETPLPDLVAQTVMLRKMLHAMVNRVMPNGRLDPDLNIREAKEVLTSASTMINMLARHEEHLKTQEQARIFSQAIPSVLRAMDEKHRTEYLEALKKELEKLQKGSSILAEEAA